MPPIPEIANIAGYRFTPLTDLREWKQRLDDATRDQGLRGSIHLSQEGVNFFLAGRRAAIDQFLACLDSYPETRGIELKHSRSDERPFKRLTIKIKPEIIAFDPREKVRAGEAPKISATTLRQWLDEGRPCVLLDVRNTYEVLQGTFQNALHLGTAHFRDFAAVAREFAEKQLAAGEGRIPVVTFCTGGIRCEKAAPFLLQCGLDNVVQLEGGILKYFEDCGGEHYDGECFVFDHRVALRSDLLPRGTIRCHVCGAPLSPEDQLAPEFVPHEACPFCYLPKTAPHEGSQPREEIAIRNAALRQAAEPLPGRAPYTNRRFIDVVAKFTGLEALDFLHRAFPFVARNAWQERFDEEFLLRDDIPIQPETVLNAGDVLTHLFPKTVEPDVNPSIEIIHEDAAIVVVHKGAPLPVHPCGRYNHNTLISMLNRVYAPQIVRLAHRIDANTSGLVVLTRCRRFARKLQPQFERRRVEKVYLVRVLGNPPWEEYTCQGKISTESLQSGARIVESNGAHAETRFRQVQRLDDGTSLLEARPITGRTNQIRVHLWDLGFSVQGDPMYLPDRRITTRQTMLPDEPPLCLHAWKLGFRHPLSDEWIQFEAARPAWSL